VIQTNVIILKPHGIALSVASKKSEGSPFIFRLPAN